MTILTDTKIRKLKPKSKRYEVPDIRGLFLRVHPSGGKVWCVRYVFEGTLTRKTIGYYPSTTLDEAREKYAAIKNSIRKGIDPARGKTPQTFRELYHEFCEKEMEGRPSTNERKRLLEKDVLPRWASKRVASITRRDVVVLLDEVRERAPIVANRLLGLLGRMFYFAAERGIIEHSPLTGMRRGKENIRRRVLTDNEIKALWTALDVENKAIDIYVLTKLALKAILLTGQRPGEVAAIKWDHIDGTAWTIPAEDRKNGEENSIPVAPLFRGILEKARAYSDGSPYVFRSSHREDGHVTTLALSNALRRHRDEIGIPERFTPHDLRRTVRTRLAGLGVSDIVGEKVLGHTLQGMLKIYNQYPYAEEKAEALRKWENSLRGILDITTPINVIPFEVRRG